MNTYRYTYTQLTTQVVDAIMRPVLRRQDGFRDTLPEPVEQTDEGFTTREYMDYYSCNGIDIRTNTQTFECTAY